MIADMTPIIDNITMISYNERSINYKTVMEDYFIQGKYRNISLCVKGWL